MLGRAAEARQPLEKAVELMPGALGRFNQRWLDDGELLDIPGMREVAEEKWKNVGLADDDLIPRSHYALAKLRRSEGREDDCQRELKRAVELDPDFYDAWDDLRDTTGPEEQQKVVVNLIRLAPRKKTPWHEKDCRQLWSAVAELVRHDAVPPGGLYPFRASQLARQQRQPPQRPSTSTPVLRQERIIAAMDHEWQYGKRRAGRLFSPAAVVMSDPAIAWTSQLLGMARPYAGTALLQCVNEFSPVTCGGEKR